MLRARGLLVSASLLYLAAAGLEVARWRVSSSSDATGDVLATVARVNAARLPTVNLPTAEPPPAPASPPTPVSALRSLGSLADAAGAASAVVSAARVDGSAVEPLLDPGVLDASIGGVDPQACPDARVLAARVFAEAVARFVRRRTTGALTVASSKGRPDGSVVVTGTLGGERGEDPRVDIAVVLRESDARWLATDVVVEGSSAKRNFDGEIRRRLARDGGEGVCARLRRKLSSR